MELVLLKKRNLFPLPTLRVQIHQLMGLLTSQLVCSFFLLGILVLIICAIVVINPANYPFLDRPPPTDSPEVAQWLSELDLSDVPQWEPTQAGFCANASNAQAVTEAPERCWWTCGGCTRATDITYCPAVNTWGVSYDGQWQRPYGL